MELLKEISPFFVVLPLIIGHFRFRSLDLGQSFLLLAIEAGVLAEIMMAIFARTFHNNMPVVHSYTAIEFCLLVSVFYFGKAGLLPKKVYQSLVVGFLFLTTGNIFINQGIWEGNSLVRSIEGLLLIVISLYYFFDLLKNLDSPHPERAFMFWVSIAMLVYFAGNLLIFIYYNRILKIGTQSDYARDLMRQIVLIGYILNIFLYSFYSIALLCRKSKPYPKSSLSAP